MKITCISELSYSYNNPILILDKSYIVYALMVDDEGLWFCILDEGCSSPMWHKECYFKITNPLSSRYWILNLWKGEEKFARPIFAFSEWSNNQFFHTDLVESDEGAWKIFRKYEKLMNLEFPDPAITQVAQIGDENWLICPYCIDAWENSNFQDALVICPSCEQTFCNPRYKDTAFHL